MVVHVDQTDKKRHVCVWKAFRDQSVNNRKVMILKSAPANPTRVAMVVRALRQGGKHPASAHKDFLVFCATLK